MATKKKPSQARIGGDQIGVDDVKDAQAVAAGRGAKAVYVGPGGTYVEAGRPSLRHIPVSAPDVLVGRGD